MHLNTLKKIGFMSNCLNGIDKALIPMLFFELFGVRRLGYKNLSIPSYNAKTISRLKKVERHFTILRHSSKLTMTLNAILKRIKLLK